MFQDPYGYQQPGYQQPGYQPAQPFGGPGYPPPPPPKKSSPLPWILGGVAALVVVVLVVVVAAVLTSNNQHPPNARSGSPSASASPSPTISTDPNRVTDAATGISFKRLGSPWTTVPFKIKEFTSTTGQAAKTQDSCDSCYAVICMGPLDTSKYAYTGPADLKADTQKMATAMVGEYYPANAKPDKKFTDAAGTQDGHQVWVWAYHLSYSASGMDAKGESVEIALVDLGNGKAGGFYTSVPDTHASDLLPQVQDALNSLTIAS